MGTKHDEAQFLAAAVDVALEDGLGALTFGRLAQRLGVADRTVVYYFPTKAALLERVLGVLGERLLGQLGEAFGDEPRSAGELLSAAWPLLTSPDADRTFALWFQLAGAAAAGEEPHRSLADAMIAGWIAWLTERVTPEPGTDARQRALALLAGLDGALLLRHLGHPEAADTAVAALTGERPTAPA